jgi:hypothetical protein
MVESVTRMRNSNGASNNTILRALTDLFADIPPEMLHPLLTTLLAQTLQVSGGEVRLVEGIAPGKSEFSD